MIGVAVIGAGYAGCMQLRGWLTLPNVRVIGVFDRSPRRAAEAERLFGVTSYPDLDVLIGDPEVDAVDVATPVDAHRDVLALAAAKGKAVLCQKPLAETYEEAEALVECCDTAGVRLMANENFRWRPWFRKAKELVERGKLGRLWSLQLDYRLNFRSPRASAVPILLHQGTHQIDIVRFLFGEPKDVFARTLTVRATKGTSPVEDAASISLGYGDRYAQVDVEWAFPTADGLQPDRLSINGDCATLHVSRDGRVWLDDGEGGREAQEVPTDDYYQRSWTEALAHFATCLAKDRPFETDGRYYLQTMAIALAARDSAATNRIVSLDCG